MITAKQVHDIFQLRLQKVASNQYTAFVNEEVDSIINAAQNNYIVLKAFGDKQPKLDAAGLPLIPLGNQQDIDALAPVIVKNHRIKLYKPNPDGLDPDGHILEPNAVYGTLPFDYFYGINTRSVVKYISNNMCDFFSKLPITANLDTSLTEYISVVPFVANITNMCAGGGLTFKITFKGAKTIDGTFKDITVFDYAWFTKARGYNAITTIKEEQDKWFLIKLVLEFLNRFNSVQELVNINFNNIVATYTGADNWVEYNNRYSKFKVYWENYKDRYHPNSFIFVTNQRVDIARQGTTAATTTTYVTDTLFNDNANTGLPNPQGISVELAVGNALPYKDQFRQISYMREILNAKDSLEPLSPDFANTAIPAIVITAHVPNRVGVLAKLYKTLQSPWGNSTNTSPIIAMAQKYIFVYTSENFCASELIIDFIKKPRPLSLKFAQTLEFTNEKVVSDIIDLAVSDTLRYMNSTAWSASIQNNQIKP